MSSPPSATLRTQLACAGVAYQAILKNPLADPYLLGVSSGATLASYLWNIPTLSSLSLFAAAISILILKEGLGVWRFISAALVVCGIALTRVKQN